MKDQVAAGLTKCELFAGLSQKDLAKLSAMTRSKAFHSGDLIFSEGNAADSIYVLASGAVELVKYSRAGREVLVREVLPVGAFGEAAVFSGEAFPATAVAREDSEVFFIRRKDLISFIKSNPEASMKMMSMMSRLLIELNSLIGKILSGTVRGRLASYLLARAKSDGREFSLGVKKSQLAKLVGTVPETLSRNLAFLEKKGAIEMHGSTIAVKDSSILEDAVDTPN